MSLSVKELSYQYAGKSALDDVSFDLPTGFTILLGPNGAGKSTLFALLTGIHRIVSGNITYNNLSLRKHRHAVMKRIGVVFQQSTLDLDLSIKQNLTYFASLQGVSPTVAMDNIAPVLKALGLSHRLDDKVRQLNGGHRRRVEIARCLIHSPQFLLLDEPTVGLDIESRKIILEFIRKQVAQDNMTVLWATHLLEEVASHDHVLLLSNGQLQGANQCTELMQEFNVETIHDLFSCLTGRH